jgi:hypothetical protein
MITRNPSLVAPAARRWGRFGVAAACSTEVVTYAMIRAGDTEKALGPKS